MNETIRVRPALLPDAPELAEVHVLAWRSAYAGILDADFLARLDIQQRTQAWSRRLSAPEVGVEWLVVCADDRVVGFSSYGVARETEEPGTGELHAINLHPEYWERGLGSILLEESMSRLRELEYRRAYLWVALGNDRATRFYEKHGWTDDIRQKTDDRFSPPLIENRYCVVL